MLHVCLVEAGTIWSEETVIDKNVGRAKADRWKTAQLVFKARHVHYFIYKQVGTTNNSYSLHVFSPFTKAF